MKIIPAPFTTHFEEIDGKRAQELLDTNYTDNRNLSPSRVNHYVEEILRGDWGLTHQGIAISDAGELIDGQHRLRAVVLADKQQPGTVVLMMVSVGVPMSTFTLMDGGAVRNAQSFMSGKYCSTRTALARTMLQIHENDGIVTLNTVVGRNYASHRIIDFLTEQPKLASFGLEYSPRATKAIKSDMFKGTSAAGLLIGGYVAGFKDNSKWGTWWDDVNTVVENGRSALPTGNPVRALSKSAPSGGNYTRLAYFKAVIAALKVADGQTLDRIRVDNDRQVRVW